MKEIKLTAMFKQLLFKECQKNNLLEFYWKVPDCAGLGGLRCFDSFLLIHGKFFAFEFKVGDNKPTKMQEYHLTLVNKCGGKSFVVHEDDYKKIINIIIRGAILTRKCMNDAGLISNLIGREGEKNDSR